MTSEVSYFTTREVASLLRVDPATVRRWADSGDVEAVKLPGGQYRFAQRVVSKLLVPTPSSVAPAGDDEGVPVFADTA